MNQANRENAVQNTLCDELSDLIPAYGLGLLTAEDTKRVEQLMHQCPDSVVELPIYQEIGESLLMSAAPIAPPIHVRANLLAKIAEQEMAANAVVTKVLARPIEVSTPPVVVRSTSRLWQALSAAAILVLVLTNAYWLFNQNTIQQQVSDLQQQQTGIAALISDQQSERVSLVANSTTSEDPVATVFRNDADNRLVLISDRLSPLNANQTYQLWLISDNGIVSAGIFDARRGLYTFDVTDLQSYPILGISIEPANGSEQPTTTPIAVSESV